MFVPVFGIQWSGMKRKTEIEILKFIINYCYCGTFISIFLLFPLPLSLLRSHSQLLSDYTVYWSKSKVKNIYNRNGISLQDTQLWLGFYRKRDRERDLTFKPVSSQDIRFSPSTQMVIFFIVNLHFKYMMGIFVIFFLFKNSISF